MQLNYGQADICINWAGGLHHARKGRVRRRQIIFMMVMQRALQCALACTSSVYCLCSVALPEKNRSFEAQGEAQAEHVI